MNQKELFNKLLEIAKKKEGLELCKRKDHGYGKYKECTCGNCDFPPGNTKVLLCPMVSFGITVRLHYTSKQDFIKRYGNYCKDKGWLEDEQLQLEST